MVQQRFGSQLRMTRFLLNPIDRLLVFTFTHLYSNYTCKNLYVVSFAWRVSARIQQLLNLK